MQATMGQVALRNTTYKKVRISEVNKRYVEAVDNIGSPFRIEWGSQPALVYVPQIGEDWIITRIDSIWKLMWKYDYETDNRWTLNNLKAGDARLTAARIILDGEVWINSIRHVVRETRYNEVPTGLIDGANKLFITEKQFFTGSLRVYLDGLRTIEFLEVGQVAFIFCLNR
jgi:hypothetical protein